ncbi:hypothetical protein glysoja_048854, partial [Glycine soja]
EDFYIGVVYVLFLFVPMIVRSFYSTTVRGLRCYENPKNKITAIRAEEEKIWGSFFKVEGAAVLAGTG